jgi:hypothetical protein
MENLENTHDDRIEKRDEQVEILARTRSQSEKLDSVTPEEEIERLKKSKILGVKTEIDKAYGITDGAGIVELRGKVASIRERGLDIANKSLKSEEFKMLVAKASGDKGENIREKETFDLLLKQYKENFGKDYEMQLNPETGIQDYLAYMDEDHENKRLGIRGNESDGVQKEEPMATV